MFTDLKKVTFLTWSFFASQRPRGALRCSLVHAHRGILQRIEGGSTGHALVLEDSEWAPQRGVTVLQGFPAVRRRARVLGAEKSGFRVGWDRCKKRDCRVVRRHVL